MSKFIGFIVGAALVVAGAITGNVALIIQGSAMIVASAAVLLTMPKVPARQAAEMQIQLGEQPRSIIFGEAHTAGSLVDGFNYGGKYGTDWECLIIRLSDCKVDSLTGFYVNDEYVAYTGNGNYPQFDGSHFELYFRADTTATALPAVVTSHAPGWVSTDKGYSGADVVVCYRADLPDAKHPAWPGGRPRFGFVVKGKLCYDPRLDSTVDGGSGSHRWDDPSTWEWTDNPAVCRYNWARGIYANDEVDNPSQLLVGRGLSESEAPPENIFAAANLCDEDVDGEPRYRVAGPIYANQDHLEVEEMFAAATGGTVVTREGSVELEPGAAKSVVATFTDDDLISGSDVSWNHGVLSESSGEWVNTVVARYVEPAQKWNDHAAPVVRDTDDILADGRPRETSVTLRLVRHVNQALRVAEIVRRLGRIWGRATVTLGPRFCEIEDGDWIQWTSERRFGGDTKTFRVEAYSINEKWQNTLTLREISSTVYGSAVFDPDYSVAEPTTPPPDVGEPDAANWALAAVMLTSAGASIPALQITGDASDDESVQEIIFEYWKNDGVINPVTNPDDPTWLMEGSHPRSTTKVDITSIQPGGTYYAAVTYVVGGIPGDRLVLGPVTVGTITATLANALTITNTGGATAGATYDGTAARTIDYSTVGAAKTGAVTGSGLTMATARLLGRSTASTGAIEEISIGTGLSLSGGSLSATGGGGGGSTPSGTSFPGSPATNDRFIRTDRQIEYYYDGTRWLSAHQYTAGPSFTQFATAGTTTLYVGIPSTENYDIYIENVLFHTQLTNATTASNYYIFTFYSITSAGAGVQIGTAQSTQSDVSNTVYARQQTINQVIDMTNSQRALAFTLARTGTAVVNGSLTMNYRLVG